jgi:hypothetical protein
MKTKKIIAALPIEDLDLLRRMSEEQNISMTDVVRRGLQTLNFFWQVKKDGGRLLVEKANGRIYRVNHNCF